MQLQKVRYFMAVCEERSFIRAARRSGVSQPSLSNAIKRFEDDLGGALFIRAVPTALALAIKPYLEQILTNVEKVKSIAASGLSSSPARSLQYATKSVLKREGEPGQEMRVINEAAVPQG